MNQHTSTLNNIKKTVFSTMVIAGLFILAGRNAYGVEKPRGTFSASGGSGDAIYTNPNIRGVLVRASWSDVETAPGVFNFSRLNSGIAKAKANGVHWSLAVAGGNMAPDWLIDTLGAPSIDTIFRGVSGYRLPLFWNTIVQTRLQILADRLAEEYGDDQDLKLVYVTQMTANGIEGHLQGVDMPTFVAAGYTDAKWITAAKQSAVYFAEAFPNKPIAFEVHEVNNTVTVPAQIINDLWNDPALEQRVGAAMWWISGKTSYMPDLVQVLIDYPGDIYGQIIGSSDQTYRFEGDDYTTVFTQAKQIGMRYIEPWEQEFKLVADSGFAPAWDTLLADFNTWADGAFSQYSHAMAACPSADFSGDCRVNDDDFAIMAAGWGTIYDADDLADMAFQWLQDWAFVTTWDTSLETGTRVVLGLDGTVDAEIDWGDGTIEYVTTARAHDYGIDGIYTVRVSGSVTAYESVGTSSERDKLVSVDNWGQTGFTSMYLAFEECSNLVSVPTTSDGIEAVTDMSYMFYRASSFNQDIGGWNTSNVTNMQRMFNNAYAFNQDLSGWCVTNIISLPYRFDTGATSWIMPNSRPVWGTCP
jgi:surface protein